MKKIITLSVCMLLLNLSNQVLGQTKRVIYVGFVNKDTVEVFEGDSKTIEVFLDKKMTGNESVKVSFKVIDKDSLENKAFNIFNSKREFTFNAIDESLFQYLRIETNKDENEDDEYFDLKLTTINNKSDKDTFVLKNNKLVVKIKDTIPSKLTIKSVEDAVRRILQEDRDTSEVIGTISMNTSKPFFKTYLERDNKYNSNSDTLETKVRDYFSNKFVYRKTNIAFSIDRVEILFKDGFASEIKAFDLTNGDIYHNLWNRGYYRARRRFGISFRDDMFTNKYNNYNLMTKSNKVLRLSDLIKYDGFPDKNFPPDETFVVLTLKKPTHELKINTSLRSYINLKIYSDFLTLLKADRSNGLVQSEFSSKLYLRTMPIPRTTTVFFNYIEPSLKYTRFENGFESVKPIKVKPDTIVDRLQAKQRTYLEIGFKLNIIKALSRFYNSIEFNTFTNFGWFNLQGDTLKNTQNSNTPLFETIPSNTIEFGAEIKWLILQYRNFGFTMGGSVMYQKIWNNKGKTFANGEFALFLSPEYELFFYPIANSKDKIFFRAKYMTNNNENERNYAQLQFGYKAEFKLPNLKLK